MLQLLKLSNLQERFLTMKKLLVVLCAGAVLVSACSSAKAPVAPAQQASAPVKHKHHKHASGINCNK